MSEHRATIAWKGDTVSFEYDSFSRDHSWRFSGGLEVRASSAPEYFDNPANANLEEALVAALSSCHMLTFLAIAAKRRFVVEDYVDEAVGTLERNDEGKLAITKVVLRPIVMFGGDKTPTAEQCGQMHAKAHAHCFVANSVKTTVSIVDGPSLKS